MKKRGSLRAFCHTAVVMLSLILLVTGSICTEYNIRRTLGQPNDVFSFEGLHRQITSIGERACWLLAPLGRAVVSVFEWECRLMEQVLP